MVLPHPTPPYMYAPLQAMELLFEELLDEDPPVEVEELPRTDLANENNLEPNDDDKDADDAEGFDWGMDGL